MVFFFFLVFVCVFGEIGMGGCDKKRELCLQKKIAEKRKKKNSNL